MRSPAPVPHYSPQADTEVQNIQNERQREGYCADLNYLHFKCSSSYRSCAVERREWTVEQLKKTYTQEVMRYCCVCACSIFSSIHFSFVTKPVVDSPELELVNTLCYRNGYEARVEMLLFCHRVIRMSLAVWFRIWCSSSPGKPYKYWMENVLPKG